MIRDDIFKKNRFALLTVGNGIIETSIVDLGARDDDDEDLVLWPAKMAWKSPIIRPVEVNEKTFAYGVIFDPEEAGLYVNLLFEIRQFGDQTMKAGQSVLACQLVGDLYHFTIGRLAGFYTDEATRKSMASFEAADCPDQPIEVRSNGNQWSDGTHPRSGLHIVAYLWSVRSFSELKIVTS